MNNYCKKRINIDLKIWTLSMDSFQPKFIMIQILLNVMRSLTLGYTIYWKNTQRIY